MDINKYESELPIKGINLDVEPEKQPKGSYRFALNITTDSSDGSKYSVINEEGNKVCFTLGDGYELIGHVNINNGDIVLISTNQNTSFSQIGILSRNCNYLELMSSDCFKFNLCFQVKGEFKIRNGCERIITLYDCNSNDLYINLDRLDLYYTQDFIDYLILNPLATPNSYLIDVGIAAWDCNKLQYNQDIVTPCLEFDSIIERSGKTEVGVYKFKLELLDSSFNRLGFTFYTQPVPIIDEIQNENWFKRDGALNSSNTPESGGVPFTRNSIDLRVSNLVDPISYVRLVVKYYNNSDGITNGVILKSRYISIEGLSIINFQGLDASSDLAFTTEESTSINQVYNTSCSQGQVNGRLLRANLKEENINYADVQKLANDIKSEFVYEEISAEVNNESNTKDPNYYAFKRSYLRDEVYAFGIILKFKNGNISPTFHIPGRKPLTRADNLPSYISPTPISIIDRGNGNLHHRNQVPNSENEWDLQLLEVTQNPYITAQWTDEYSQHPSQFNPDTHVILDNVEHLGIVNYNDDIGYGLANTVDAGALVPRYLVFNTAINYSTLSTNFRGTMSYHQSKIRYPRIKDCNGNFIYPIDPLNPNLTDFIRHHKMPDIDIVPHIKKVGNNLEDKKIVTLGVIFDTESFYNNLPVDLLNQIEGHYFVRSERNNVDKTILDKGIYSVAQENWKDGEFCIPSSNCEDAERVPGTYYDPLRYEPLQAHGLGCTSNVGMYYSPKTLFNNAFPGTSFTIKYESAIYPSVIDHTEYPDLSRDALEYVEADNLQKIAYCFFDLKSFLRYTYASQDSQYRTDVNTTAPNGAPIKGSPHYRARFINRKVNNARLVSPETNISMDIENTRGTKTETIVQFKNILQTNPVLVFEKKNGLPRGILKSTNVNNTSSLPYANEGQAGWNTFYIAIKLEKDVYTNLSSLEYLPITTCIQSKVSFLDTIIEPIYGGDIFISRFTYTLFTKNEGLNSQTGVSNIFFTTSLDNDIDNGLSIGIGNGLSGNTQSNFVGVPYSLRIEDGRPDRRGVSKVMNTYVESEINVNLRNSGTGECNKYFEKNFTTLESYFDYLKDKECQDYFSYNNDYSVITNEDKFKGISETFNFCSNCSGDYPNRIAWSPKSFETELRDSWKITKPNDFIDIPSEDITNLKFDRNQLLVLTKESLFQMTPNPQVLQTDIDSIQLGTGDFLSIPAREFVKKSIGYAGNQGRFNAVSTEFGFTWVDQIEGKVFNYGSNGLQEISKRGLYHWFKENLNTNLDKQLDYKCIDNTANSRGIGLMATFDPKLERYILHKQDYKSIYPLELLDITSNGNIDIIYYDNVEGHNEEMKTLFYIWNGFNYIEIFLNNSNYFENKSWTISYDYKDQSWKSWHSYQPNYMLYNDNNFYSYIKSVGSLPNSLYKHGEKNFTNFYNLKFPMVTEFVITNLNTVDLHNLYWYSRVELYDELTQINKDVEKVTFNRLLAYTNKQSTGELRLNVKVLDEDNLDWSVNERTLIETDSNFKVSNLRDMSLDNNILSTSWNDIQGRFNIAGSQGYIDKVDVSTRYGSVEQEDLKDIKSKYFIIRLWRVPDTEDYKIIFNLAQANLFYSIR